MKELPINENPYIRTFTEYAYVDMIMNNEMTNGELMLEACISEEFDENWITDSGKAEIELNKNYITIKESYKVPRKIKHVYRKAKSKDELIIKIEWQQYTNLWDSVGLFLDNTTENLDDYFKNQVVLGNYCGNVLMTLIQGQEQIINPRQEYKKLPVWLKLVITGNGFELYYALEQEKWIHAGSKADFFDWENNEYIIGVYASMSDRQYYKWIFNNFIHLCLNMNDASTLNYCAFVKRECKNYTVNPLIKFSVEKSSVLEEYGIDLLQFIKGNINQNRYIEFWLNEKYIPGLKAYGYRDYDHESLVYGYDGNTILMLSIYGGKPKKLSVDIRDFNLAHEMANPRDSRKFYVFELQPTNRPYEFDVEGIIQQLEDYLCGKNPTLAYKRLMSEEVGVFGLNCYKFICNDISAKTRFLEDKRMSYILQEHKKCMRDRVEYMIFMGYLNKDENIETMNILNEIYEKSTLIMNMVIKNQIKRNAKLENSIWLLMNEVSTMEEYCYKKIIDNLRKNVNEYN